MSVHWFWADISPGNRSTGFAPTGLLMNSNRSTSSRRFDRPLSHSGALAWLFAVMLSASVFGPCPLAVGAGARPNVVIFLADDQGWGDFSITGNQNLVTPNIDSLGRAGAMFDRFFVCAVCSPTRAEFLTGRYLAGKDQSGYDHSANRGGHRPAAHAHTDGGHPRRGSQAARWPGSFAPAAGGSAELDGPWRKCQCAHAAVSPRSDGGVVRYAERCNCSRSMAIGFMAG